MHVKLVEIKLGQVSLVFEGVNGILSWAHELIIPLVRI
jgi:hypothetical protein